MNLQPMKNDTTLSFNLLSSWISHLTRAAHPNCRIKPEKENNKLTYVISSSSFFVKANTKVIIKV